MIELKHLCKKYENYTPLSDINTVIDDHDIISVIGPNGTGKSTLLRCINMLEKPTSGQIIINGTDITARGCKISEVRQKVGMVFQNFNLFGHLTVLENIMQAPMDILGMSRNDAYMKAMDLLHEVSMESHACEYPDMLSGGQKQRVAIARTLAMDPDFVLFDEPTSSLDPTMKGEVEAVIKKFSQSGKGMIIVTHELKFAREICNRVFFLCQGEIYEEGTPDQIFDHPKKEITRRFIHHLKVFETVIKNVDFDFLNAVSEIKQYCLKNQIPPTKINDILSVFEEMCQQILLSKYECPNIRFSIEYDEVSDTATCYISYCGEPFDPRTTDNTLSLAIIKKRLIEFEYNYIWEEAYPNRVNIKIR